MALPTGLLVPFVFALTVGVTTVTTLTAHLSHRRRRGPFRRALRTAVGTTVALVLCGSLAVWWLAGGVWGVGAVLVVAGVGSVLLVVVLPLWVGRRLLVSRVDADADAALRLTTTGLPVAALAVFLLFVAPGGGTLLALGGPRLCLVGFCGVSVPLLVAVVVASVVTVVGPGVVGLLLHSQSTPDSPADDHP